MPDPFFLPPPFIPSHAKLREMCKSAVVKLQDKRGEMEADIVAYVNARVEDMRRLEDEVRGEVEVLWSRWADAHAQPSEQHPAPPKPRESFDGKKDGKKEVPFTDLERPSGVTVSPPKISGQHNYHAAQNQTSSLLAASISANAFHAPPPKQFDDNKLENIAKTVSREQGVDREVAMSFAFSTMEEQALKHGRRKKEEEKAEDVEVEVEEEEKGIDSWIGLERAEARKRVERGTRRQSAAASAAENAEKARAASADAKEKGKEKEKDKGKTENGEPSGEKKKGVKFQEPEKSAKDSKDAKDAKESAKDGEKEDTDGEKDGHVDGLAVDNDDEEGKLTNRSRADIRIRLRHGDGHADDSARVTRTGAPEIAPRGAHLVYAGRQLVSHVCGRGALPPRGLVQVRGPDEFRPAPLRQRRRRRQPGHERARAQHADQHRDEAAQDERRVPDQDLGQRQGGRRRAEPDPRDARATRPAPRERRARKRERAGHELCC